jgi:hypothetical protein
MCEIDLICTARLRLGNVKIAQPGITLIIKNPNLKGGDDNAIFLNLLKEVIPV